MPLPFLFGLNPKQEQRLSFAETLKRLRIKAGKSRYKLAQWSGLSETYIMCLENGERANPSRDVVLMLALALVTNSDSIDLFDIRDLLLSALYAPLRCHDSLDMSISIEQAGRKGGISTRNKHGLSFLTQIGAIGGRVTVERHKDKLSHWGRLGGRPRKIPFNEMEEVRQQNPSRKEAMGGQLSSGSRTSSNPII